MLDAHETDLIYIIMYLRQSVWQFTIQSEIDLLMFYVVNHILGLAHENRNMLVNNNKH